MTATTTSTAVATIQPAFTDADSAGLVLERTPADFAGGPS